MATDRVRVGADFNAATNTSEVTRIDLDTVDGVVCIAVQHLGSRGMTIVDMYFEADPTSRKRLAEFESGAPVPPFMADEHARSFGR